ncbi:hypothetical protein DRE_06796 [Drechslerella stenobrocha 248]|uniref:Uncharacterized protein n=1 Tax=Drechslerella stenobrocha 248 TaxID=1043628 RepID=W7HWU7_9PEZI|nr:hypothetical protein DRE_06796 [Drechslerella stenobrocha 248]
MASLFRRSMTADSKGKDVAVLVTSPPQSPMSPTPPMSPTSSTSGSILQKNYITNADRQRAIDLMVQQRVQDKKEKKTKKAEAFTSKEANPVLAMIVADKSSPPSPGLVQALLEHGGNVNIARGKSKSLLKMVTRKDQKDVRSDLLTQATQNCSHEVVSLLAQQADDIAKNEALPFAIVQNDPAKARVLINSGADAGPLCAEFLAAVDTQWEETVSVVLSGKKGPCQDCRNRGLVKAVNKGSMTIAQMLLDRGADADFQSGAALQKAVEVGREDLATAITSCAKRPSPGSLDISVEIAYVKLATDADKQHRMIEDCLKTGAKGSKTDEILVEACKKAQAGLIDILLTHGASVDHSSGSAIKFSIISKQPELLTTLLRGKPSNATMAAVVKFTMALDDLKVAHILVDILLSAGLRGDSVGETLISAIETGIPGGSDSDHLELVKLLLEKGEANVNLQGGKSVILAATQGRANVLTALLQHKPSVDSLNAAFPCAINLVDPALRLEIATMILEAGAKGKVVDDALVVSANTGKDGASLTSVILKQSSVDYEGGKPLINAVNSHCLEQMKALMLGYPSASTVAAAWVQADAIEEDEFQLHAFEVLLTNYVDEAHQDKSLVAAATRGQRGYDVCALLLKNDASPDRLDAAALIAAAKGLHLDTLSLLAKYVKLSATFATTFDAFSEGEKWLGSRGLEIVHFILEQGASGPEVDAAFCKAARLYEPDALELLATSINPGVLNVALVLVTQSSEDWFLPDNSNLWLTHSLLEWGAQGDCINIAFLKVVDAYSRGVASEQIIDTFLTVGNKADVNFQNGEALQIAIRYGKAPLLEKLATHGATKETIALAFAEAVIVALEEDVVLSLINSLVSKGVAEIDFNAPPEGYQQPLFASLAAHPKAAKLAERLIKLGCNVEAEIDSFLYDDEQLDAEPATVLAWALSQDTFIESAVVNVLVDEKANVNFTAKLSKATPLILAAKKSRGDIVAKLLQAKASNTARDQFDRSALFYASRAGDLESVNALIKAKAPINDGSLQEAAKKLHSEVVAALVKGKHSPNFPSSKEQHQGRTALQEMCLMCDASKDITAVEATINALIKGKPKVLEKSRERTALFLALDNAHPVPITKALLDSVMWEHINDRANVYVEVDPATGTRYYFSPTTYVARGFSQGPEGDNGKLLELLQDKRCEDRYYAEEGAEQPEGAIGMPKEIIDAEKKRKEHEDKLRKKEMEHQLKLLHAKQEADLKEEIDRSKHEEKMFREDEATQQKLDQKQMMHQQQLIQDAEKAAQKQDIMASTNDLKVKMQEQADASKQRALQARADFDAKQKARMMELKASATQQENDLKLEFTRKANAQKLALQDRQTRLVAAASERKLLMAQQMAETRAAEARHKLAIKEKQDQLTLKLMKGTAKQKHDLHDMKMQQMRAQSESMKLKMLDGYFAGQPKNLKRITAA